MAEDMHIRAGIDQELAEIREEGCQTPLLTEMARVMREQFGGRPGLAEVTLLVSRAAGGLMGHMRMPPELLPAALQILAGELARLEREADGA